MTRCFPLVAILPLCLFTNFEVFQSENSLLSIEILGFSNSKGKLFLEIVTDKNKVIKQVILPIKNNQVSYEIQVVKNSNYGIKVYHDENNNQQLDKNIVGYPIEKWGVSNNARPPFREPTFEEIKFWVKENYKVKIQLK